MGERIRSRHIQLSLLQELQNFFHKEAHELIDLYILDAKRKIANLYKALEENNLSNFTAAARELRLRSVDIGAVSFSFVCLTLEIAVQETRLESLKKLTSQLECKFSFILEELLRIRELKTTAIC